MGIVPRINHLIKRCFLFSIAVAVYPYPPFILHESVPLDVSVISGKVSCHFVSFEKDIKTADHADFKALGNEMRSPLLQPLHQPAPAQHST